MPPHQRTLLSDVQRLVPSSVLDCTSLLGACGAPSAKVVLFDANGTDRSDIAVDDIEVGRLRTTQILWVDCTCIEAFDAVHARLRIPGILAQAARETGESPAVLNTTEHFWIRVSSVSIDASVGISDYSLDIVAGRNVVITIRRSNALNATELMPAPDCDTALGRLDAASFVAAILHRLLTTYFDAVSDIEDHIERIDQTILDPDPIGCTEELRHLLRTTARLRRRLARHRVVFSTLARPDFSPADEGDRRKHFAALDEKYERAIDVVEDCRDLVVDCFELFSSRTALDTNRTMRTLTFLTVLIGTLAVTTGVLGMNFEMAFFRSETGFWIALAAMIVLSAAAWWLASRKRWA